MKYLFFYICVSFFSFSFAYEISDYKVTNQSVKYHNHDYTILRSFTMDKKKYNLAVDEKSLETKLFKIDKLKNATKNSYHKSRYFRLLQKYSSSPFPLQNDGLKHISSKSVYLTVDMCPSSKKGFEDAFFKNLIKKYPNSSLTLFISGKWIEKHQDEFLQLLSFQKNKNLNITWGNHTYFHHYSPFEKLEKNFLLLPQTDVREEVLKTEKKLLSYGVVPSILFRFPGLVSNEKVVKSIKKLGLIPVGSDTWLAKDEKIHDGSVILIHGNKNEPDGIKKANQLLLGEKSFIIGSIIDDL